MSNEIEKPNSKELVDSSLFQSEISGFEGTDSSTFKTPFVKILQQLSPELKKNDSKFIEGAELGQFCNTATQEVFSEIDVIVLKIEHSLVAWRPDRGGFVGRYSKLKEGEIVAQQEGVQKWDAMGNEIVDTIEFFCVNANDSSDIFILPMSVASFKHGRSFATRLRMLKADGKPVNVSWAGIWKLSTVEESNEKGSWYTIGSTPDFLDFITKKQKEEIVEPSLEILKTAETDYSAIDNNEEDDLENTEF